MNECIDNLCDLVYIKLLHVFSHLVLKAAELFKEI